MADESCRPKTPRSHAWAWNRMVRFLVGFGLERTLGLSSERAVFATRSVGT